MKTEQKTKAETARHIKQVLFKAVDATRKVEKVRGIQI